MGRESNDRLEQTIVKYSPSRIHWEFPLNFNLYINNERQDYKIDSVGRGTSGSMLVEWRRLKWGFTVDELYIPIWKRIKKPLAISLSGMGRGLRGETMGVI
jgi:hypothetical protein